MDVPSSCARVAPQFFSSVNVVKTCSDATRRALSRFEVWLQFDGVASVGALVTSSELSCDFRER